ncbi:hypothetical protein CHARACLAT_017407, partial [Characodon lateralis]|nr:hypothetical protein [Characodon lateralis]
MPPQHKCHESPPHKSTPQKESPTPEKPMKTHPCEPRIPPSRPQPLQQPGNESSPVTARKRSRADTDKPRTHTRPPTPKTQQFRGYLQSRGMLDQRFNLVKHPDGTVLLPILSSCLSQLDLLSLRNTLASDVCDLTWSQSPLQSKKEKKRTGGNKMERTLQDLLESLGERWMVELRRDLPRSFQRHGDLILLGDNCFTLPLWEKIGDQLWVAVAEALGAKRLAKMSRISKDGFRSPVVTMLLGDNSWVKHVDNGISYEFDVTKCMFSAGNITEKLRVAGFDCRGETVVDLYA